MALGDNTTITSNKVSGTQLFDAVDVCSNSNTVKSNTIYGSAQSGVHVDDSCGSGNNNTVTNNSINEACAGVLLGTGTGTTTTGNSFYSVVNTTLGGDVCPAVVAAAMREEHLPSILLSDHHPTKLTGIRRVSSHPVRRGKNRQELVYPSIENGVGSSFQLLCDLDLRPQSALKIIFLS
jgi:hypothetical protein